ncbi:kinesin-like protein costa [Contarinia nasturtii]|uniref:kinesin-like protein costa n=1 Tax=Contarinia nasturtii TaxID=265458 RepID=UPI0012D48FDE|nr:kinesin-like protein costa [Contarinia nasturtii]
MYLKQECESFSSAGLISNGGRLLKPIQETDENSENDERSNGEILEQEKTDHSGQNATFSDNESDADENLEHVEAKIPDLMINFSRHVNKMIEDYYKNYVDTYPKAVLNSYDDKPKELAIVAAGVATNRRRSVQVGDSNSGLSSSELDHLNRIAEETTKERLEESIRNSQQMCLNTTVGREATAFLENSDHLHPLRMATRHQSEVLFLNHIRRFRTDIEAKESKITELKQNIKIKKELMKINSGRDKAKRVLNRKVASLETKKERCIKAMERCEKKEIDKWKMELSKIETQLTEISRLRAISQHSDNTIKGFQQDIEISDKQLKMLEKALEADKKSLREAETKWKSEKAKNAKTAKEEKRMSVDTRITQFDSVLKEKSEYLQKNNDESEMVQSIRHEIRNLRSQRDRLTDAQCLLNQKLKKERLTEWETRKILEYDVAKEVIDHAMEMKNQLICGRDMLNRKSVGNPDLMSQLNKLNEKEMRVLLYKCFQKIVDLRDSSRQLEIQLLQLEQERNEWKLRERVLCDEFQQSRLVGERNTLDLQRHYERTLTMLLQRAGEDCAESPNIPSDSFMLPSPYSPFTHSNNRHHAIRNEIGFGIHDYKSANQHQQHAYRFANTAVATTSKREIAEREIADALNNPKQKATGSLFFRRFASSNGFKRNIPQLLMANGTPQNTTTESKVSLVKRKNSSRKIIIQQNKP